MKQAIKAFRENTYEIEDKLKNKANLLQTPVILLNDSEIEDIKTLFFQISQRIEILSKNIDLENSENFEFLTVYHQIIKNYNNTRLKIESKIEEYLKTRENVLLQDYTINFKRNINNRIIHGFSRDDNSDISDYSDKNHIEISKVFLNSIITSKHINKLQSFKKINEEKEFISEILNLDIKSQKDQILIDYYINAYKFCLKYKFSVEKISTFLSIIFFLFNYSILNKKIIKEKSFSVFMEILEFHIKHCPPFCFEIFNSNDKELILDYMKKTFFRNLVFKKKTMCCTNTHNK